MVHSSLPLLPVKQRLKVKVVPWTRTNSGLSGGTDPFDAWHSLQDLRRAAAGVLDVWAIAIRANPDSTALTWFSPGP